jgi:hypothetical protein
MIKRKVQVKKIVAINDLVGVGLSHLLWRLPWNLSPPSTNAEIKVPTKSISSSVWECWQLTTTPRKFQSNRDPFVVMADNAPLPPQPDFGALRNAM